MGGGYAAIGGTYSTDEIADSIQKAGYEVMFHTFAALLNLVLHPALF